MPLGSIPELPADSCEEIKASEGRQAVSGSYWLDSMNSGDPILVFCYMEKGSKFPRGGRGGVLWIFLGRGVPLGLRYRILDHVQLHFATLF